MNTSVYYLFVLLVVFTVGRSMAKFGLSKWYRRVRSSETADVKYSIDEFCPRGKCSAKNYRVGVRRRWSHCALVVRMRHFGRPVW